MDNLEKAVAGIGKSLKNNMPRIVKRNKGDLSFSSAGKPGDMMAAKDEEASNAMIAKIPHSPSMPGESSSLGLRKISAPSETAASPSYSHLTNYSSDPFKLLATEVVREMQMDPNYNASQQGANKIDGISLGTLTKVIQTTGNIVEKDEPWKWQELIMDLSSASAKRPMRQNNEDENNSNVYTPNLRGSGSSAVKSVFTFPKRVTNGDVRKA